MTGSPQQAFSDPSQAVSQAFASPQIQQQAQQALPQTGIQQQAASLQLIPSGVAGPGGNVPGSTPQVGTSNVAQLAQRLAQGYGLPIGRGNIVDEQGNFLVTPDQLSQQSGMGLGETAAKMNYVSQALARAQTQQQQQKGIAAVQTGLGLVQKNARGSLAAMQSGMYQDLADLYSNQEYAAADFSYFIQKEQMDFARDMMRRQEKLAKKGGMMGSILGGAAAGSAFGPIGALAGGALGFAADKWF